MEGFLSETVWVLHVKCVKNRAHPNIRSIKIRKNVKFSATCEAYTRVLGKIMSRALRVTVRVGVRL